ncbi:MAG TPA: hypothetical protein VKK79_18255 [Candidatus Lokiarchaeia archaeon]|nr:hypothetical protein [Candidatus Lokiarchaeia archaeon]
MSKKVAKIGRYWTRTCAKCGKEIPNWFLKCPVCKAVLGEEKEEPAGNQSTRIFAQVIADGVVPVEANLIYTPDQGNNWYRLPMVREEDFFAADIPPMERKTIIAYFLEAIDVNGKKYIEDNGGQYYFFEVKGEELPKPELKAEGFIPFPEQVQDTNTENLQQPPKISPIAVEQFLVNEPAGNTDLGAEPAAATELSTPTNVPGFFSNQHKQFNIRKCECGAVLKESWTVCPICGRNIEQ